MFRIRIDLRKIEFQNEIGISFLSWMRFDIGILEQIVKFIRLFDISRDRR